MARQFTAREWEKIHAALDEDNERFGLPSRVYGSIVIGSFNIRKLGKVESRNQATWDFLAKVCQRYDLLAIQEIQDDLSGLRKLKSMLPPEYGLIVSDKTGALPKGKGLAERLGFLYNRQLVERTEIATDISYDRSSLISTLTEHRGEIFDAIEPYADAVLAYQRKLARFNAGEISKRPSRPTLKMPRFLSFIRTPFCVSFEVKGHPGTESYRFMAVNAHLYFGDFMTDRQQEFEALMNWLLARVTEKDRAYYENFVLLGDLNLDFDKPDSDRRPIEKRIREFYGEEGEDVVVNFPFLDKHPSHPAIFRTNARLTETFDQVGLFVRDPRFPHDSLNKRMGKKPVGPDYGVFDFVNLFSVALKGKPFDGLSKAAQKSLVARFEHKVSDHMPLWLRMPLPK